MPDLADGESTEMKGSAAQPYILKNTGGVYSCTCPAWRNQSVAIERRTCKHIRKLRGDAAEAARVGSAPNSKPAHAAGAEGDEGEEEGKDGPGLLLAQTWDNAADLSNWWMSEKLDGVRAYWDGQQFISRLGNVFHAPDWFIAGLPNMPLDGELWLARKAFQRTVSIVRRQDKSDHWKEMAFLVFDAPTMSEAFERRIEKVKTTLAATYAEYARAHEHVKCRNLDHLRAELARVEGLGGEGLMLRQPESTYEIGRSSTLLKVKTFHDAEATVISHEAGAGRHKGRLGALAVKLADGTTFSVGTGFSDKERENPPAAGSVITFRYQELSDRGVPRFPSFVRVRTGAGRAALATVNKAAEPAARQSNQSGPATPVPDMKQKNESPPKELPMNTTRYFEFKDEKSAKFWEIRMEGNDVTIRFGKVGANGQTQTKSFADLGWAQKHADRLITEKTTRGYVEAKAT